MGRTVEQVVELLESLPVLDLSRDDALVIAGALESRGLLAANERIVDDEVLT